MNALLDHLPVIGFRRIVSRRILEDAPREPRQTIVPVLVTLVFAI